MLAWFLFDQLLNMLCFSKTLQTSVCSSSLHLTLPLFVFCNSGSFSVTLKWISYLVLSVPPAPSFARQEVRLNSCRIPPTLRTEDYFLIYEAVTPCISCKVLRFKAQICHPPCVSCTRCQTPFLLLRSPSGPWHVCSHSCSWLSLPGPQQEFPAKPKQCRGNWKQGNLWKVQPTKVTTHENSAPVPFL